MTNSKPQALRIRRRKVERRQRKEQRRIARELARLNVNGDRPYWEQPEE
tara:strand:+ start:2194 stop:2340 length:147 start_codon:yes stop_codon:yes gene_type:complete